MCSGCGRTAERTPGQHKLGETQGARKDTDGVSLGFRLICGAQDGARGLEPLSLHPNSSQQAALRTPSRYRARRELRRRPRKGSAHIWIGR